MRWGEGWREGAGGFGAGISRDAMEEGEEQAQTSGSSEPPLLCNLMCAPRPAAWTSR